MIRVFPLANATASLLGLISEYEPSNRMPNGEVPKLIGMTSIAFHPTLNTSDSFSMGIMAPPETPMWNPGAPCARAMEADVTRTSAAANDADRTTDRVERGNMTSP